MPSPSSDTERAGPEQARSPAPAAGGSICTGAYRCQRAMLVAIDGPAGAGKSTVARAVAARARLHLPRLRGDVPLRGAGRLRVTARSPEIAFDGDRVLLDGEDVTERDPHARDQRAGVRGRHRPGGARARSSPSSAR